MQYKKWKTGNSSALAVVNWNEWGIHFANFFRKKALGEFVDERQRKKKDREYNKKFWKIEGNPSRKDRKRKEKLCCSRLLVKTN